MKDATWNSAAGVVHRFRACQDVGVLFEAACLVLRLSDWEGVEIHNLDSWVIQKARRTEKGRLSLFLISTVAGKCFLGP